MNTKNSDTRATLAYALKLVHAVCYLAGSSSYVDDIRADMRYRGVTRAVREHDTAALFDWLIEILSFQGVSDSVAANYMAAHGNPSWSEITEGLAETASCSKLGGYWQFHDCRYQKMTATCSEPSLIDDCPLPRHALRNGRLNQMAYSLFFFMRDIANGDFVAWLDQQLHDINLKGIDLRAAVREAVIDPLRGIYGADDKVVAIALSPLLMCQGRRRPAWFEVGANLIAVDTLVHNFLHRTGILSRFHADHPYGPACYRPEGCEAILQLVSEQIDARQFNKAFPARFPRFVQSAIWRYCAENGLDVCNGNQINDSESCANAHCQLFLQCDRIALRVENSKKRVETVT